MTVTPPPGPDPRPEDQRCALDPWCPQKVHRIGCEAALRPNPDAPGQIVDWARVDRTLPPVPRYVPHPNRALGDIGPAQEPDETYADESIGRHHEMHAATHGLGPGW